MAYFFFNHLCLNIYHLYIFHLYIFVSKTYLEPNQTSVLEIFAEIVNG